MRNQVRTSAVRGALLLHVALAACAGPAEFVRRPAEPIGWPSAAAARISYEFGYGSADDVECHPGFWGWLWEAFVGEPDRTLVSPRGVACGDDDVVWIADPGRGAVHRLGLGDGDHAVLVGNEQEPFAMPVGIAVAADGRVFVADSARARIIVLAPDGAVEHAFGDAAGLGRPTGIAYDASHDRLLVVDTVGCRLLSLARDGTVLAVVGGRGSGLGEFNAPTFLCVLDDGAVAVVDSMNFRVQLFDAALRPQRTFGEVGRGPGTFASPKGVAADADGHIYVVDGLFDNVQIFDRTGRLLLPFGSHGARLGEMTLPSGICACAGDRIVVADGGNARIQVFRYTRGKP